MPNHLLSVNTKIIGSNVLPDIAQGINPMVLIDGLNRMPLQQGVQTGWPEPIDLLILDQMESTPPRFIMEPWLPCGYATLFAGHGGVGKSGIALVLAVCIGLGIPFFGMPVERRRVLYLSCEDRTEILHWRLSRICAYLGIKIADLSGWLDLIDLVGQDTILYRSGRERSSLHGFSNLSQRIHSSRSQVLFVDGISDTFSGNENDRAEVKGYVNNLLALISPDDGAVIMVGHVAKLTANNMSREGYSGSTGWHNAVRARWYLYPESKAEHAYSDEIGRLIRRKSATCSGEIGHPLRGASLGAG